MRYAIRTSSAHSGHAILVTERLHKMRQRSHHYIRGYMVAGATAGEIVIGERNIEYVSFPVWLIMLCWTGWQYRRSA